MKINVTAAELRAAKIRAGIEVLGFFGLVALFAVLVYAPGLVFGGTASDDGRPLVVLARCASTQ